MKTIGIGTKRLLSLLLCCVLFLGLLPATAFAKQVETLDPQEAGVYGWRIVDKDDNLVGGVRYPGDAGVGPVMQLGDEYFPGIDRSNWGQYESATVDIGVASRPLKNNDDWDAVAQEILDAGYKLQIFMVDVDGDYDTATGTYPYAWVEKKITHVTPNYNHDNLIFKLDFEGSYTEDGGYIYDYKWDYTTTGNNNVYFVVSVTEPDNPPITSDDPNLTNYGVYGWRIVNKEDGSLVGGVRYPGSAGGGPAMNLTDDLFPGIAPTGWGQYVNATVNVGSTGTVFEGAEDYTAFVNKMKENYQIEVFFVNVAGDYVNGKYPYGWVAFDIDDATFDVNPNVATHDFTLQFKGSDSMHWDWTGNGPGPATFKVTATEADRPLNPDQALSASGVYGWRIRDNASGDVLGGVRYPWSAGDPNAMNLDDYFTEGGNQIYTAFPYETAQVNLNDIIGMTLENDEDYAAFKAAFQKNYTLEIFFVDTHDTYKAGKYPCEWVACDVKDIAFADPVEQNGDNPTTHTLTLQAKGDSDGADGFYWDYSTSNGPGREEGTNRYKATFSVTATEPMKMTTNRVTAWGVTDGADFTAMTMNYAHWVDDLGRELTDLYKAPLAWPTFCNNDELEDFLNALLEDYQIRVSYRNYNNNPWDTPVDVGIKKVELLDDKETDEYGNTFARIKLTPAVAHKFGWHWSEPWVDTTSVDEMPLKEYVIRVQLVDPVDEKTAKEHTVTSRVVDPPSTKVNFFDYWLEENGQFMNDFEAYQPGSEQEIINKGINKGHLFSFMGSFAFPRADGCYNIANLGRWNVWTGDTTYAPNPDGNVPENNDGYGTGAAFDPDSKDGILKPHSGIVARKLGEDGYPQLALGDNAWATGTYGNEFPTGGRFSSFYKDALSNSNESLAYLFNTEGGDYKEVVEDVTGLFQIDNQGYYYYNSRENFAELDKDEQHITLYDEPWKVSASVDVDNDTTEAKGQFFPFNAWSPLFSVSGGKDAAGKTAVSQNHYNFRAQNASLPSAPINHYFGMTVETEFQQPINGTITQGRMGGDKDIPMEFYFSGDDDVWVFIDDVLVGDIGGIHNPVSLNINFATGVIEYTAIDAPEDEDMNEEPYYTTTLKDMYEAAKQTRDADPNAWVEVEYKDKDGEKQTGYIYPNGSIHTLKFYYLERGNDVSNCSIRFNTLPVVKDSIRKVDDNGDINFDASFDLYRASANKTIEPDKWYNAADFTKGDVIAENIVINNDPKNPDLYTIMYENGKAVDFTKFVTDFSQPEYFILDEKTVPAGFRGSPGIVLEFHPSTYTFTVKNKYETGAYASFSAEWKQIINETYAASFNDGRLVNKNEQVPDVQDGLTVVVPLMKINGEWKPLYGSNTKGWHTVEKSDSLNKDLAQAALLQIAGTESMGYQKWVMDLTDIGNLFSGITNLPGDATRYVINQTEDDISAADLTLVALYIPQTTLADKLGVAGSNNSEFYKALFDQVNGREDVSDLMAKVEEDDFTLLYSNDFQRSYRTVIYAPNEQRELRVRKVDPEGKYLDGAVFAIFDSADKAAAFTAEGETAAEVVAELTEQAKEKEKSGLLSFGTTGTITMDASGEKQEGMLIFRGVLPKNAGDGYAQMNWPKDRNADNTEFWLKEIYAPEGYNLNENLVRVEAGNTAIYANATGYDSKGNMLTGDTAADDGIAVQASMGKLAQTLVQYAINNAVDVTLRDITITKQIQADADKLDHTDWTDTAETYNMHFGTDNATLGSQYGPHEDGAPIFQVEDGYVRVIPQQTQTGSLPKDKDHTATAKLEELSGIDLDSLFGLPNTVVVTDTHREYFGDLTIQKEIAGTAEGTDEKEFHFTITADTDKVKGNTYDDVSFDEEGKADVTITGAGSITIPDLPEGTYTIEEDKEKAAMDGYTLTVDGEGDVTVTRDTAATATVTNTYTKNETPPPPETGSLEVSKQVTGTAGEKDRAFQFTMTLDDTGINGTFGDMEFIDGTAEFTLKDGESKTAADLPAGTAYTVTEKDNDGYTVTAAGDTGTINTEPQTAAFINHKDAPPEEPGEMEKPDDPKPETTPPTGDETLIGLWLTAGIISLLGIAAIVIYRKRR